MAAAACSQTAALLGSRASGLSSGSGGAVAPPAPRRHRCKAAARAAAGGSSSSHASPQQKDAASLDVSGAVVSPSFRSTPWAAEAAAAGDGARPPASVLLVSESGICRAPLAAAALAVALQRRGLGDRVQLGCRASRDFCLGEGPDPAAASAAADLGLALPQGYAVQQFKEAEDIVTADVVLVVDKFVAADVLREVSVFDTIKTWGQANYSSKVRRLGEFNPGLAGSPAAKDPEAGDIGDPLYGNVGGEEELAAVRQAAADIQAAAEGFADFLAAVAQRAGEGGEGGEGQRLGDALLAAVREMEQMDWMVPPMLQPR